MLPKNIEDKLKFVPSYKQSKYHAKMKDKLNSLIQEHPLYKGILYDIKFSSTFSEPLAFTQNGKILGAYESPVTSEIVLSEFHLTSDFIMSEHELIHNITQADITPELLAQSMVSLGVKEINLDKKHTDLWNDLSECAEPFYHNDLYTPIISCEHTGDYLIIMKSPALEIMLKSPAHNHDTYYRLESLANGHDIILAKKPKNHESHKIHILGQFELSAPLKDEDLFKIHALFKAPKHTTIHIKHPPFKFKITLKYELTSNKEGVIHIMSDSTSLFVKNHIEDLLHNDQIKHQVLDEIKKLNCKDEFKQPIAIRSINIL